jgi:arginyl-tRNA synthetase
MVTVMRGGEEVKISKRAGSYVTLQDLIEEVGCDATRFFLAARRADSQMTFDIDLARSQSNENPVYYIQYAHARICSIFRKLENESLTWNKENGLAQLSLLTEDAETGLINKLGRYAEVLSNAASASEPHQIATYLKELASDYHSYYNAHKMIIDDENLRDARITLSEAARQVIQNGMSILGVSSPREM